MIHSMTGFASRTGAMGAVTWMWELRSVNARGLDLRLRLPDGCGALEAPLRAAFKERLSRGNVTCSLRLIRDDEAQPLQIDTSQLDRVLDALDRVQERAFAKGVTLGQPTAADVLAHRGVVLQGGDNDDQEALIAALQDDIAPLLDAFVAMRQSEGAALLALLTAQIDEIDALVGQIDATTAARQDEARAAMTAAFQRVMQDVTEADETRLMQELAMIAVKQDVTEERDRLGAHVAAARKILGAKGPAGRKLDFLSQEFNREANTLCAKAQNTALTSLGLELKAVIDRMREQIQNVE